MSAFELIPMHGGDAIRLPPGETVFGRGPFLRVSDKRVSRHHGLLDNRDGRLRLKPTHRNPCFLQSSPADEPRPLQKDAWRPLGRGDVFSLLPGQLMFRVVAAAGGGPAADGPLELSAAGEKRRRLPSWMMAAVRTSASPGRRADEKSGGGEDLETKVKRRRKEDGRAVESRQNTPTATAPCSPFSNDEARRARSSRAEEKDGSASRRRTACPYGNRCYRKKPLHFRESSHPGDSDYEEEEEEEEEERAECPYGADCYRKNPLHHQQYRHPKRAVGSRRAVPKAGAAPDADWDSGDGFIEDADGDSDYAPSPDSD